MSDQNPKWEIDDAIRRGKAAHRLALQNRAALEPRLEAGAIDTLGTNLVQLGSSITDKLTTTTEQKGRTGTERDYARDGHGWVINIRNLAQRTRGVTQGEKNAVGVGEKLSPKNTKQVVAAIQACLNAFAQNEGLATRLGVIEADQAEARAIITNLTGADESQGETIATSKDMTFDRDQVRLDVEAAVDAISSRGQLAFRKNAPLKNRFASLVSSAGPVDDDEPLPTPGSGTP